MPATASIATPATDAVLRKRYRKMGAKARANGIPRDKCPCDGLIAGWWEEGWDGVPPSGPETAAGSGVDVSDTVS